MNPFGGLLKHPDGETVYVTNVHEPRPSEGGPRTWRVLNQTRLSFPYRTFERAVLTALKEVKPRDVLADDGTADRVQVLEGRKAELEKLVRVWKAKMDDPNIADVVAAKLGEYKTALRGVEEELAEARAAAALPASAAWEALPGLVDTVDQPDGRLKLRAVLRRVVSEVRCVFAKRGEVRLAAVQIFFEGQPDRYRLVYVLHRPASGRSGVRRPARWWRTTYRWRPSAGMDLRDARQAKRVESILLTYDPEGRPGEYPEATISGVIE